MNMNNNDINIVDYIDQPILAVVDDIPQMDELTRKIFGKNGRFAKSIYKSAIVQNLSYVYKNKDNKIIAICLNRYESDENKVEIDIFCVDENYRKRGLAKKLLLHSIENCKTKGIYNFCLNVSITNITAINFYFKFGFKIERFINDYYPNDSPPDSHAYVMVLNKAE